MQIKEIEKLVKEGLSLIPVHETGKQPLIPRVTGVTFGFLDLVDKMREVGTTAIAVKCGEDSGRLIGIDIDTKYNEGIGGTIISDLNKFYSDLLICMRFERTPSGGIHIFYRVDGDEKIRGFNCSKRLATEEEILEKPKSGKTRCFIEVKADGLLLQSFPSPGYERISGDIGILSWEEHIELIAFFRGYDKIPIKPEQPKIVKAISDLYIESPFDHFNFSDRGESIFGESGWSKYKTNGEWIWWTKPGGRKGDVDASFNIKSRLFHIWSTTSGFLKMHYNPASFLMEANGYSGKDLYSYLVSEGFGKINPAKEKRFVKSSVYSGTPLPMNVSNEARIEAENLKKQVDEKYPYGIFWKMDDMGKVKISQMDIDFVVKSMGFRAYSGFLYKIDGFLLKKVTDKEIYDTYLLEYIGDKEEDEDVYNEYSRFIDHYAKGTTSRIMNNCKLRKDEIFRSSKKVSYKFYKNVYLKIEADGVKEFGYETLGKDKFIFENQIINRDWEKLDDSEWKNGLYWDYLNKAINDFGEYEKKCIGFYAHDYRDEKSYMILCTEICEEISDGAGSGKSVFTSLLKQITTFKSTPASSIKTGSDLFQSWEGERVYCFADIPKSFDLLPFKENITGNAVVNKKYVNEFVVDVEDAPKFIGTTNYSFDNTDPGVARRIRVIEFSDFFTISGGVDKYYDGKMFPMDWNEWEYTAYDNSMVECIQSFLKGNSEIEKKELTGGGWIKQFEQKYHSAYGFIKENWKGWIEDKDVTNEKFNKQYEIFCMENHINPRFQLSSFKMNLALKDYAAHEDVFFDKNSPVTVDGFTKNSRKFIKNIVSEPIIFEEKIIEEDLPF